MTTWQLKGLLLLASALVATALVASTSGTGSRTSVGLATQGFSTATAAPAGGWDEAYQSASELA